MCFVARGVWKCTGGNGGWLGVGHRWGFGSTGYRRNPLQSAGRIWRGGTIRDRSSQRFYSDCTGSQYLDGSGKGHPVVCYGSGHWLARSRKQVIGSSSSSAVVAAAVIRNLQFSATLLGQFSPCFLLVHSPLASTMLLTLNFSIFLYRWSSWE